ncbi:hypothetical protein AU255_12605 [Methyloprofundus sedimenti]|uniref:ABC transporter domain-containing protein n=1 Tax=Methyloprofundus sedimenti TaxID=1420851 RepID=A0A1V8MBA8_9GAMM|nr:sn-glycerol-3-phosphate ABC transporter ATP-binding protein UgpC [Methyloprofundus sedimenti]OQK18613.1 hypothetical protein AU255_12605 [Methyloprofundus sedimenti]
MANITLKNVGIELGSGDKAFAIHGISIDIAEGEFIVFVGPSGSGKSTVLRAIAGLESIAQGEIWIGDERVDQSPPTKRGLAMVFQNYALYPNMTVAENMGFALKLARVSRSQIKDQVYEAAALLRIEHLLTRKPKELSGGQRQRVAIGRAIVRHPKAFLFDEPLSNLDAGLRNHMRIELLNLHRKLDATMLYVTHDQVEAMTLADRIVLFSTNGVEQIGTPQALFNNPINRYVAEFIGTPKMNMLPAHMEKDAVVLSSGEVVSRAAFETQQDESFTLGIRPRHIQISEEGNVSGEVVLVERLGDEHLLHIKINASDELIIVSTQDSSIKEQQKIGLEFSSELLKYFAADGKALKVV